MAAKKTVSTLRSFKTVDDAKLNDLKKTKLKKRTEAKMNWGVRAYNEWRSVRLSDSENCDIRILNSDLNSVEFLRHEDFEYSMCKFIAEVTKVRDGSDYPGSTLYQLCVAIQKFLVSKGLKWKLIEGGDFEELRNTLDNVMKERAANSIGTIKKRAELLSLIEENFLWESGVLGDDCPDKLRSTVLFLLGINVGLRARDEHYQLRRESQNLPSQLQFKRNKEGVRCLVYYEDCTTKTNDGGLNSMRHERKVVWVYPGANVACCPVKIVDKYMSLLPPVRANRKANFYLRSLEKYTPAQ